VNSSGREREGGDALVEQGFVETLIFAIGRQRYGLPASDVRELLRAVTIVPLPKAPAIVEGVIDVRGRLAPVLDIRTRFRLPPKPLEHTDHFIVAVAGDRMVALRADRALELARLDAHDIADAATLGPGVEYVAGIARLADGLVLIHDLRSFLSETEAATLDAALRAGGSVEADQ
jgi:purine-binding chemotaxis protein CheW